MGAGSGAAAGASGGVGYHGTRKLSVRSLKPDHSTTFKMYSHLELLPCVYCEGNRGYSSIIVSLVVRVGEGLSNWGSVNAAENIKGAYSGCIGVQDSNEIDSIMFQEAPVKKAGGRGPRTGVSTGMVQCPQCNRSR
jgi:hypothetical protein